MDAPLTRQQRDQRRAQLDRIIADTFRLRCMNNTRWRKVLRVLGDIAALEQCTVKLVWDPQPRTMRLGGIQRGTDFYDASMEGMVSGYPRGFYDYREIEWLRFGDSVPTAVLQQALRAIGQLDLEVVAGALVLYAYRR